MQARIEQKRQVRHAVTVEDNSHDYKTLRSSRIKQIRGIYQTCRDTDNSLLIYPNISDVSGLSSVASPSIRGEKETRPPIVPAGNSATVITQDCNQSRLSSIPSLQRGDTIESSCNTNHFEDRSIAVESAFSRGKLFTKMMQLLDEMNPPQDISISDIVSMCASSSPKGDGCSVAELKLIQKLTEEEMSRILREFERDNSLVDNKTVETEEINAEVAVFPTDIRAGDDFSQVTSPTFADGVELDEVEHLTRRYTQTQRPAANLLQSVLEIPMAERDQSDDAEKDEEENGVAEDIHAKEDGPQEADEGHQEPDQEQSNGSGSTTKSELELRNKTLAMSRDHVRRMCEEEMWISGFANAKDAELEEVTSILSYYEDSARRMQNGNEVDVGKERVCMEGIHDEGNNEDMIGPELVSKSGDLVESAAATGSEQKPWGCGVCMCLG